MRKHYTAAFKAKVVQEMLSGEKSVSQISSEHEVHPNQLRLWKQTVLEGMAGLFERADRHLVTAAEHEQQVTDLFAEIGRLSTQVAWLKKKSGLDPNAR
jgi:putative transposase